MKDFDRMKNGFLVFDRTQKYACWILTDLEYVPFTLIDQKNDMLHFDRPNNG